MAQSRFDSWFAGRRSEVAIRLDRGKTSNCEARDYDIYISIRQMRVTNSRVEPLEPGWIKQMIGG
jgi:hypothetical protein